MSIIGKHVTKNLFAKPFRTFLLLICICCCTFVALLCLDIVGSMELMVKTMLTQITGTSDIIVSDSVGVEDAFDISYASDQLLVYERQDGITKIPEGFYSYFQKDSFLVDTMDYALAALDICTIFSNMLDNAMEAVSCLSAEQRVISVSIRKNNHFLLIHEKNYTGVKPVIVDGQIKSTKKNKDRHGFGISNIKEAAAKYDGDVQIAVTENEEGNYEFVMEIMIPY